MPGGTNRLVGLLGILHFGLIDSRGIGQVIGAVLAGDDLPCRLDGHSGQVRRVGTHVGNVPVLVEALGHLHRPPGGEAALAVGFLLQRAGGERRIGLGRIGLVFQLGNLSGLALEPGSQFGGLLLVHEQTGVVLQSPGGRIEVAAGGNSLAIDGDQHGLERFSAGFGERGHQVPVGGRAKGHALPLALDDQPHGHALHSAGRKLRPNLPPQERRDVVAVKPVDDPPHFLCPHQGLVDRVGGESMRRGSLPR